MFKNTVQKICIVGVVLLVSGCQLPFLANVEMNRTAYVTKIYSKEELKISRPNCLSGITMNDIENHRYVEVRRLVGRQTKVFTAELPPDINVKVRDRVAISSGTCLNNAIPKIERLLEN
jgi:hypothetical protein